MRRSFQTLMCDMNKSVRFCKFFAFFSLRFIPLLLIAVFAFLSYSRFVINFASEHSHSHSILTYRLMDFVLIAAYIYTNPYTPIYVQNVYSLLPFATYQQHFFFVSFITRSFFFLVLKIPDRT